MAISSVKPGGTAIGTGSLRAALGHPAVKQLAELLKFDLNNEALQDALVADAQRNMETVSIRGPPTQGDTSIESAGAAKISPTNYRVRAALKAYEEIARL